MVKEMLPKTILDMILILFSIHSVFAQNKELPQLVTVKQVDLKKIPVYGMKLRKFQTHFRINVLTELLLNIKFRKMEAYRL